MDGKVIYNLWSDEDTCVVINIKFQNANKIVNKNSKITFVYGSHNFKLKSKNPWTVRNIVKQIQHHVSQETLSEDEIGSIDLIIWDPLKNQSNNIVDF